MPDTQARIETLRWAADRARAEAAWVREHKGAWGSLTEDDADIARYERYAVMLNAMARELEEAKP